ncbi:MAG TPA: LapA family protein [Gammaproteobacteria bacterium]|nr:LapA family protein [Gammaproteobacteria bacterium]
MRIVTYILLFIIIIIGITFAVLNPTIVTMNYYLGQKTLPLSLLLVSVFSLGCFLGLLVGGWLVLKAKIKNYRLKQKLKIAEKEVQNLRTIPLQDRN